MIRGKKMVYDVCIAWLLVLSACGLLLFGILLMILVLISRRTSYYRRVGIKVPRAESSLSRLIATILKVLAILLLVGLLVILAFFTISYISKSQLLDLENNRSTNKTDVPSQKMNNSVLGKTFSQAEHESLNLFSILRQGLTNYWMYVTVGFVSLIILILILHRPEQSSAE